jgi:hypothetical protein
MWQWRSIAGQALPARVMHTPCSGKRPGERERRADQRAGQRRGEVCETDDAGGADMRRPAPKEAADIMVLQAAQHSSTHTKCKGVDNMWQGIATVVAG